MRISLHTLSPRQLQLFGALGAIIVVLLIALFHGSPADFPSNAEGNPVLITVAQGESGSEIALALAQAGVVKSSGTFIRLLDGNSQGIGIAPGVHKISTHIPARAALSQLLDRSLIQNVIVVTEGSREADVERLLRADKDLISKPLANSYPLPLANPAHSLEGQLAPAQYSFTPGTTTGDAIKQMLAGAAKNFSTSGISHGFSGYSPYQLLTIASLVQIEADPADFSKAVRVIYNRLQIGMPLQLNSTVAYAANISGQIGLSISQTHVQSAYNTYLHQGLPPTPISNPSLKALQAVTHPAVGNWLYFITVKPHDTRFTNSYSEFEGWVTLYNHNVSIGAFK